MAEERPRAGPIAALFVALLAVVAAFWLPRWWEEREYRAAESMAGVGSRIYPGALTDARRKIDPGRKSDQVVEALGKPSLAVATEGTARHDIWTYYYADGTMTVNLTDGIVQRISTVYGTPRIPTSARPK
jgi:hypothetical protein